MDFFRDSLLDSFRDLSNEISFRMRSRHWGRWGLRTGFPRVSSGAENCQRERRFYELALNRAFHRDEARRYRNILDVGCRNWSYVRGLAEFFPNAEIRGLELDGGRRYWNLFRREDYAWAYARELMTEGRKIRYATEDFLLSETQSENSQGPQLFCFFFPFVSANPCLSWGLPKRYSDFGSMVQHASKQAQAAAQEGQFFSLHQGEWEAELARAIYLENGIEILQEGRIQPAEFGSYWPARHEVWYFRSTG